MIRNGSCIQTKLSVEVERYLMISHNKLVSVAVTHGGGAQSEVYEVQAKLESGDHDILERSTLQGVAKHQQFDYPHCREIVLKWRFFGPRMKKWPHIHNVHEFTWQMGLSQLWLTVRSHCAVLLGSWSG